MSEPKKILLVSDSHGQNNNLWYILKKEKPYQMLVHCGDFEYPESELVNRACCEVHLVRGNNDHRDFSEKQIIRFGSHTALIVHGHRHRLYAGLTDLYYAALEAEADYVFFGHLHRPVQETYNGITFLNPGSVTYPRQEDRKPTYMTLCYDDKGNVSVTLHSI